MDEKTLRRATDLMRNLLWEYGLMRDANDLYYRTSFIKVAAELVGDFLQAHFGRVLSKNRPVQLSGDFLAVAKRLIATLLRADASIFRLVGVAAIIPLYQLEDDQLYELLVNIEETRHFDIYSGQSTEEITKCYEDWSMELIARHKEYGCE